MKNAKADYGIDAPGLVRGFVVAGGIALAVTLASVSLLRDWHPWGLVATAVAAFVTLYAFGMASLMIVWSTTIKRREREQFLDLIDWRGDEVVLDVGCGRGLMLVGAARRLTTGRAIGIDIWEASDQSANTPDAALANARIEGVADRVEVQTADMRALPFADASVDVIVSHWAVHNLEDEAQRARALSEMARVLRPAGVILLADIACRDFYARHLAALGFGAQRRVVRPFRDVVLAIVSFGSFRPAATLAQRIQADTRSPA